MPCFSESGCAVVKHGKSSFSELRDYRVTAEETLGGACRSNRLLQTCNIIGGTPQRDSEWAASDCPVHYSLRVLPPHTNVVRHGVIVP